MHKTISMSLQGVSYPAEEAAYDRLDRYLSRVRRSFPDPTEAEEVASDIEARMAERLAERLAPSEMVILEHAEWLVAEIGDPADLDADSEPVNEEPSPGFEGRGRLFKNAGDRMIAGVCGGLAAYFRVDTVWVRLAFVLAVALGLTVGGPFSGFAYLSLLAIVGYVVLWVLLPGAATTASAVEGAPAGANALGSLSRQTGAHDTLKAVSGAIVHGGREGATLGRDAASRIAGAAREPLTAMPQALARGTNAAWDASSHLIGATLRVTATVLGIALIAIALVGTAATAVTAISLVADDVPTFIGFYAEYVAPFRAANGTTFLAMSVAGFLIVCTVLVGLLALGVKLAVRRSSGQADRSDEAEASWL